MSHITVFSDKIFREMFTDIGDQGGEDFFFFLVKMKPIYGHYEMVIPIFNPERYK